MCYDVPEPLLVVYRSSYMAILGNAAMCGPKGGGAKVSRAWQRNECR